VAAPFRIVLTDGAEADLMWFKAFARRTILDGVDVHLRDQPTFGSRRVTPMRPNPVAAWELRLGDFRVLYDVDEESRVVTIQVIGEKRGN
jgi:mRNA-degrading endonuclease RelE of RelBE toxin-antitoxin system